MSEQELHPNVEWIAREARRPVVMGAGARERLLDAIREEPLPERPSRVEWFTTRRRLALSPMVGAALAAGLVGIGVLAGRVSNGNRDDRTAVGQPETVATVPSGQLPSNADTVRVLKFVLVAPQAATVSVVGDFNGWDAKATMMTKTRTGGTWSVTMRIPSGRHLYAFVVDGKQWMADPSAPLAPDDGFGTPNSVALVGGSSS